MTEEYKDDILKYLHDLISDIRGGSFSTETLKDIKDSIEDVINPDYDITDKRIIEYLIRGEWLTRIMNIEGNRSDEVTIRMLRYLHSNEVPEPQ